MDNESKLIFEQYLEESWKKGTSKAPKGKSFDMARGGAPSNVDAARDGSGGRYRKTRPPSARSNKTHGEMEEDIPEEDDLGLGPNTPSMIRITSIGSTTPFKKKTEAPIEDQENEDETVYIQAGSDDECGDDCECNDYEDSHDYDGELDMARAELLKAADYLSSVFHYLEYEALDANVEDDESSTCQR
jgi:hypothetical protein